MTSQLLICLILYPIFTKVTCESSLDWHYTGENVALHKMTEQTPGTENNYYGNLSVDGNSDSSFEHGSCSHTNGSPWGVNEAIASWKVFLRGNFPVTGIIIVNRDELQSRLKNFIVYGSHDDIWKVIYNDTDKNAYKNATIHIPLDGNVRYSEIAVNLPKHRGDPDKGVSYLTLCEVEVYAAPPKCNANNAKVSNGYVDIDGNTGRRVNHQYTVGTVLIVKCNGSFLLNGSLFVKCMSSGEYNSTFPTCIDTCPGFLKSTHVSDVSPDLLFHNANSAVTITCTYGYKTITKNPIVCLSDGKWDSPIPTCDPIQCPKLHNPDNGKYMMVRPNTVPHSDSDLGLEARVVCDTGYVNKNNNTRICQLNETWSRQEAICMPVLCNHPGNITNGAYVFKNDSKTFFTTRFSYNTVLKSSCNNGYILRGPTEHACKSDKTWSGEEPNCDIVTCDFPGQFENGKYMIRDKKLTGKATDRTYFSGKVNFSIEIQAICVRGFILISKEFVRRCTSHGTWTGKVPVCEHAICEWPLSIKGGYYKASRNRTNQGMPYNTTLTSFCHDNYKLQVENEIRRCNESALWDKEPAKCNMFEGQKSIKTYLIGGLSTAAIVLFVSAISTFCLYRRWRRARKESQPSMMYSDLQPSLDHSQDNKAYTDLQIRQEHSPDQTTNTDLQIRQDHSQDHTAYTDLQIRQDHSQDHTAYTDLQIRQDHSQDHTAYTDLQIRQDHSQDLTAYTDLQIRHDQLSEHLTYTSLHARQCHSSDQDYENNLEKKPCSRNTSVDETLDPAAQHRPVYCNTAIEQLP